MPLTRVNVMVGEEIRRLTDGLGADAVINTITVQRGVAAGN